MAEPWIKMRCNLANDEAVIGIASALKLDEHTVVGKLHCLWSWADRESRKGHVPAVTPAWVNRHVRADGFAQEMVKQGWLVFENDGISFPNFDEHMSGWAKNRGLAAKRQSRKRSRKCHAKGVTRSISISSSNSSSKGGVGGNAKRDFWEEAVRAMQDVCLNTGDFRAAWLDWVDERKTAGRKAYTRRGLAGQIHKLEKLGHDRAIAAIRHSIIEGYAGIYERKGGKVPSDSGKTIQPGGPSQKEQAAKDERYRQFCQRAYRWWDGLSNAEQLVARRSRPHGLTDQQIAIQAYKE